MFNIFSSNYLSRKPIDSAMREFAKNFKNGQKILDIGCGNKPYAKYFNCEYIGLDPYKEVNPDIVANAWEIPVSDNYFDGVVMNQSLEHITKTKEAIAEIKRILKPGGLGIITVPQTMKNHSMPVPSKNIELNNFDKESVPYWNNDYYRFTKFGLIYLFKDFRIVSINETSGFFGTLFQLVNYFFSSLGFSFIFIPLFLLNNIFGYGLDLFFFSLKKLEITEFRKFSFLVYLSLTLNYILIIQKNER